MRGDAFGHVGRKAQQPKVVAAVAVLYVTAYAVEEAAT